MDNKRDPLLRNYKKVFRLVTEVEISYESELYLLHLVTKEVQA